MIPDLTAVRSIAESALIDRCIVRRDIQGTTDDTIDESTGRVVPPANDTTTVYEGPCLLGKASQRVSRDTEGQQGVYRRVVRFRFPLSAVRFLAGDIIEMTASTDSRSNPQWVEQKFRVFDPDDRSLLSTRLVLAEDITGRRVR